MINEVALLEMASHPSTLPAPGPGRGTDSHHFSNFFCSFPQIKPSPDWMLQQRRPQPFFIWTYPFSFFQTRLAPYPRLEPRPLGSFGEGASMPLLCCAEFRPDARSRCSSPSSLSHYWLEPRRRVVAVSRVFFVSCFSCGLVVWVVL